MKEKVETGRHDAQGFEKGDPNPVEWPLGLRRPPTLQEMIKNALRSHELMRAQAELGRETLEESMDFEVGDDPDDLPVSPHEIRDMAEEQLAETAAHLKKADAYRRELEAYMAKAGISHEEMAKRLGLEKVPAKASEKAGGASEKEGQASPTSPPAKSS